MADSIGKELVYYLGINVRNGEGDVIGESRWGRCFHEIQM
jgi:hypothetical protein